MPGPDPARGASDTDAGLNVDVRRHPRRPDLFGHGAHGRAEVQLRPDLDIGDDVEQAHRHVA